MHSAIEDTLGDVDDPSVGMNAILRKVVSSSSFGDSKGDIVHSGDILTLAFGQSSITIRNINITNIDSVGSLSALYALDEYTTRSSIGIGYPNVQASIDVSIDLIPDSTPHLIGDPLKADLRLRLGLSEIFSLVELFLQLNIDSLTSLQIGQIVNIKCLASAVERKGLAIQKLNLTLGEVALGLECLNCKNAALEKLADLSNSKEFLDFITSYVNENAQRCN